MTTRAELEALRAELETTRAERDELREQLSFQAELISAQQLMIEELGAPFIPVSQTLAIVPLVGPFEVTRLERLVEQLCQTVTRSAIATLVLDFTGVAVLETGSAASLAKLVDTLALVGTHTILAGLGPEVARTLAESDAPALLDYEYHRSLRSLLSVRTR